MVSQRYQINRIKFGAIYIILQGRDISRLYYATDDYGFMMYTKVVLFNVISEYRSVSYSHLSNAVE